MKRISLLLATVAIAAPLSFAQAADIAVDPSHFYLSLDGTYDLGGGDSGIENGFALGKVQSGDGVWGSATLGYVSASGWDWRLGAGYADLSAGGTNDTDPNEYGVDDAKMFNIDADVGYEMGSGNVSIRPSLGVRYLQWDQDMGFHPDVPLGCCFMNSSFGGIGPKVGFDTSFGITDQLSLVGGADASVLFGSIDFERAVTAAGPSGDNSRTALALGGYVGMEFAISESLQIGAKYKVLYLDGASYDNQRFLGPAAPSGKASNVIHGPTASLTFKF